MWKEGPKFTVLLPVLDIEIKVMDLELEHSCGSFVSKI